MTKREKVVAEATTWLRTPYHPHAMIKGVGVDCARFPEAVYKAVGLVPADAVMPQFAEQYFVHRNDEVYLREVQKWAVEVEAPGMGDFALFKFGRIFWHGAIVVEWPKIIHVVMGLNVMFDNVNTNSRLSREKLHPRPVKFFTVEGIDA